MVFIENINDSAAKLINSIGRLKREITESFLYRQSWPLHVKRAADEAQNKTLTLFDIFLLIQNIFNTLKNYDIVGLIRGGCDTQNLHACHSRR